MSTSILKSPAASHQRRSSVGRVHFALPIDLRPLILNHASGENTKAFDELVSMLNDTDSLHMVEQKISLLHNSCSVVGLLDQSMHKLVIGLLSIEWLKGPAELVKAYEKFVLELLAAHNYYARLTIEKLVNSFKPELGSKPVPSVDPPEELLLLYSRIHELLDRILNVIPMAESVLMQIAASKFPYMARSPLEHQMYVYNLFKICDYRPNLRPEILALVISRMVNLDVQLPRELLEEELEDEEDEDEEDMEVDMEDSTTVFTMDDLPSVSQYSQQTADTAQCREMQLPIAQSLDVLMEQLFVFVKRQCDLDTSPSCWQHHRQIYRDLWAIFEKQLLLTHGSHHVQFVMFFLCSLRSPTLGEHFLGSLWTRVTQPGETSVSRQSAACYVASLLARARYITPRVVRSFLAQMAGWCHSYVAAQQDATSCDVRQHPVFYTVCQGLFYVVAFRHADLVNTNKGLLWTQSLGLGKLVTSRLNPLKPCLSGVAQNFAAVTRTYQLAYCYTVLERNARASLPCVSQHSGQPLCTRLSTFFPFDPYLLSRSCVFIKSEYRQYEALEQPAGSTIVEASSVKAGSDGEEQEETDAETDDEAEEYDISIQQTPVKESMSPGSLRHLISPSSFPDMFNYGTSPGFKHV